MPESQPPSFAKLHSIPAIGNCASQNIDWNMMNKTEIRITYPQMRCNKILSSFSVNNDFFSGSFSTTVCCIINFMRL